MNQIYHQIHLLFWTNNQANIESYKKTNFINCQKAQPAPHPLRPGTTTSICCCWQRATSRQRYRRSNRDVRGEVGCGGEPVPHEGFGPGGDWWLVDWLRLNDCHGGGLVKSAQNKNTNNTKSNDHIELEPRSVCRGHVASELREGVWGGLKNASIALRCFN